MAGYVPQEEVEQVAGQDSLAIGKPTEKKPPWGPFPQQGPFNLF